MSNREKRSQIEYLVACVTEFAHALGLDYNRSFDYLDQYQGMDFLVDYYDVEHTLSIRDVICDLRNVCRRHGGKL